MPNVQPIQQPVIEDLRNALQIAQMWVARNWDFEDANAVDHAIEDIARLIRHAIEGLSEPSLAAVQAAAILTREIEESTAVDRQREARDLAAAILRAAVTGEIPRTWESNCSFADERGLQCKYEAGHFGAHRV